MAQTEGWIRPLLGLTPAGRSTSFRVQKYLPDIFIEPSASSTTPSAPPIQCPIQINRRLPTSRCKANIQNSFYRARVE